MKKQAKVRPTPLSIGTFKANKVEEQKTARFKQIQFHFDSVEKGSEKMEQSGQKRAQNDTLKVRNPHNGQANSPIQISIEDSLRLSKQSSLEESLQGSLLFYQARKTQIESAQKKPKSKTSYPTTRESSMKNILLFQNFTPEKPPQLHVNPPPNKKEQETTEKKVQEEKTQKKSNNPLAMLFGGLKTPERHELETTTQKKDEEFLKSKQVQDIFKKWIVSDNKTYESWQEKLKNQKSLKLKDYMRLASLSNESRYKKSRESRKKEIQNKQTKTQNKTKDTMKYSLNDERNTINSEFSINLIKNSINKKLKRILRQSEEIMKTLDEKDLLGHEYEDLVFMCNIHKAFDQNLFQSTRIIRQIFTEYKNKKKLSSMKKEPDFVEKIVKTILKDSNEETAKKKKSNNIMNPENIALELLKIIPKK